MKIGEVREIALEKCYCDLEIAKAEVIVLSKKRDELAIEAYDKNSLKSTMYLLSEANKDLKKFTVKQKGLRKRRHDDGREISSAFTPSGPVRMNRKGQFIFTAEYKGESHRFVCRYESLFQDDRYIWSKKSSRGFARAASRSVPTYLVPYVWREVADPWTALEKGSAYSVYRLLEKMAEDHVWIRSASYRMQGSRWIYGIGFGKGAGGDTFRIVTGNAGKNNVVCTELDDSMDIAILRDHSRSYIFVGANSGRALKIPLHGWGGEPKVRSRKSRGVVARDYTCYERLAWHYLHNFPQNTVKVKNRIPINRLRVRKRGELWRPE